MLWPEIHAQLSRLIEQQPPVEAIAACHANPDAVRAHLLAAVQAVVDQPALIEADDYDETYCIADLLLIQWRDPALFPLWLKLARADEETVFGLLGDEAGQIIAWGLAACGQPDDLSPLLNLIHDHKACVWMRIPGIEAMAMRAREGELDKAVLVQQLRQIAAPLIVDLQALLESDTLNDEELATNCATADDVRQLLQTIAYVAADLQLLDMRDECLGWCACDYLADENETEHSLRCLFDKPDDRSLHSGYLKDALAYVQSWHYFQSNEQRQALEQRLELLHQTLLKPFAVQPVYREGEKIGRNDPCTCGSGKKYKKCCGLN